MYCASDHLRSSSASAVFAFRPRSYTHFPYQPTKRELVHHELRRRRMTRLQQVRDQSRELSHAVLHSVSDEMVRQMQHLTIRANRDWSAQHQEQEYLLARELKCALGEIGTAHKDASSIPEATTVKRQLQEKNKAAAQRRGQAALQTVYVQREVETRDKMAQEQARKKARENERLRTAWVVSQPLPQKDAVDKIMEGKTKFKECASTTTLSQSKSELNLPSSIQLDVPPVSVECFLPYEEVVDARTAAEEEIRWEALEREKLAADQKKRSTNAKTRGQKAEKREKVNRDYQSLMQELGKLEKNAVAESEAIPDYCRTQQRKQQQGKLESAFQKSIIDCSQIRSHRVIPKNGAFWIAMDSDISHSGKGSPGDSSPKLNVGHTSDLEVLQPNDSFLNVKVLPALPKESVQTENSNTDTSDYENRECISPRDSREVIDKNISGPNEEISSGDTDSENVTVHYAKRSSSAGGDSPASSPSAIPLSSDHVTSDQVSNDFGSTVYASPPGKVESEKNPALNTLLHKVTDNKAISRKPQHESQVGQIMGKPLSFYLASLASQKGTLQDNSGKSQKTSTPRKMKGTGDCLPRGADAKGAYALATSVHSDNMPGSQYESTEVQCSGKVLRKAHSIGGRKVTRKVFVPVTSPPLPSTSSSPVSLETEEVSGLSLIGLGDEISGDDSLYAALFEVHPDRSFSPTWRAAAKREAELRLQKRLTKMETGDQCPQLHRPRIPWSDSLSENSPTPRNISLSSSSPCDLDNMVQRFERLSASQVQLHQQ